MGRRRDERGWVATFLLVAAFLGLCAVPVLVYQGVWARVTFIGGQSAETIAESHRLLRAALITALAASLVGLATGWWLRSTASVVVMSLVLFGSVVILVGATVEPSEPMPSPTHCQERSGGDNDCPGG
ncbi:hypothetical protein [Cryptosporangium minutisporangium]|uniref:Uncharacterized protein n=1 Tax=Cryptosporangium minutisporangium TaxID=113569 RepID=A0ABP6ST76_9ACTN